MATILAVDDEFGILEVIRMTLEEDGHHVLTALNGQQGLDRLLAAKVDLVLLDFMMPVLDGPGLLRAMRTEEGLRHIPVVMMSSLGRAAMEGECGGARAYLRKPFPINLLLPLVSRILADGEAGVRHRE